MNDILILEIAVLIGRTFMEICTDYLLKFSHEFIDGKKY